MALHGEGLLAWTTRILPDAELSLIPFLEPVVDSLSENAL
jgi:hypothetical protein